MCAWLVSDNGAVSLAEHHTWRKSRQGAQVKAHAISTGTLDGASDTSMLYFPYLQNQSAICLVLCFRHHFNPIPDKPTNSLPKESDSSLQCSHKPATWPWPQPNESSPHSHTLFIESPF
jgi:hypothetical protein